MVKHKRAKALGWVLAGVLSLGGLIAGCGPSAAGPGGAGKISGARHGATTNHSSKKMGGSTGKTSGGGTHKTGTSKSHIHPAAPGKSAGGNKSTPRVGAGGTKHTGGLGGHHASGAGKHGHGGKSKKGKTTHKP